MLVQKPTTSLIILLTIAALITTPFVQNSRTSIGEHSSETYSVVGM